MSISETMDFSEYFEACTAMEKETACPDGCELRNLSAIPPVWVPPPQHPDRFARLIISRNPTPEFIPHLSTPCIE